METVVIPDVVAERREQVRAFMDEHVYPNEHALLAEDEHADALIAELQQEARDAKKAEAQRKADELKRLEAQRKADELKHQQEARPPVKAKCQPPGQYNPFDFSCAGQGGALKDGVCPPCK